MKVDLVADALAPADAPAVARAAEAIGFDGMWVAETDHEPFVTLPLAVAATTRLELGTAVAVAFARSPTVLAQAAFDLAALSGSRFALGLGTQVRAHVQRRFGMEWSAPAPRLGEWIDAIRAAWAAWQDGVPFRHRSEHLDLSLMSPFFSPPPLPGAKRPDRARIPISIAGVGAPLARLAGRKADGFHVHPLQTAKYLAEVLEPALATGEADRDPNLVSQRVERYVPVFLAPTDLPEVREAVRQRVAFYASTPSYRGLLALHGREHAGERLSRLAVAGRWPEMAAEVDDELLDAVAVSAPLDGLADALAERVQGHAERVMPLLPFRLEPDGGVADAGRWERLVAALRSS
jgi:probable F420-dependent oxidoreductase